MAGTPRKPRPSPQASLRERVLWTARHYLPALLCAGAGILVLLLTHVVLSEQGWAQVYGPNVAASLLELVIVAGFLQWLVERQQKPIVDYAHRRVQAVLQQVVDHMHLVAEEAPDPADYPEEHPEDEEAEEEAEDDAEPELTFEELRARYDFGLPRLDYPALAERPATQIRSPLERMTGAAAEARREYTEAADAIGRYCDPRLVAALEELVHGERTQAVWTTMNEVKEKPEIGWTRRAGDVDEFAAAVERCLRAYRASTGEAAITRDMRLD